MGRRRSTRKLLEDHIPDFCWQTAQEILSMLEQIDEDIPENSVCVTLARMHIEGVVLSRPVINFFKKGPGVSPREYRTNPHMRKVRQSGSQDLAGIPCQ